MQAAVIGNFDGFHRGHRRLFELAAGAVCRPEGGRVWAVTFEPLPAAVLAPGRAPVRLTSAEERRGLLLGSGLVDEVIELVPDSELLGRSPEEFILWLRERVPFDVLVEGPDFRFGRGRAAGLAELREFGLRHRFSVIEAGAVRVALGDGREVEARSSTVRAMLGAGEVSDAARVLGRPYELACTTARGDQRGRTIGWPTANLDAAGRLLPADGVYAGAATLPDGRVAIAAISVGTKPTFGESARTCEATLLAADGAPIDLPLDWYGWTLRLRFHERVRGMVRFESLDALLVAMEGDRVAVVRAMAE